MKRFIQILIFVTAFIIVIGVSNKTFATSWAELDPQEVSDKAKVIVSGKYDFSSEPKRSDFIFEGYEFNVNNVYKGDVSKQIIVGIDGFDVGWAEEFQNEGGEFLLFLEESEGTEFLTPVGGPNGMVQVLEGKVVGKGKESNGFYDKILKTEPIAPEIESAQTSASNQSSNSILIFLVSGGILIVLAVLLIFYRRSRKNPLN